MCSREETDEFRAQVYDLLLRLGEDEAGARAICNYDGILLRGAVGEEDAEGTEEDVYRLWGEQAVPYNTPQSYAELMTMQL